MLHPYVVIFRGKKQCFCFSPFCEEERVSRTLSRHFLKSQPKLGLMSTLSCKGSWEVGISDFFSLEMSGDGTDVREGGLQMAVGV